MVRPPAPTAERKKVLPATRLQQQRKANNLLLLEVKTPSSEASHSEAIAVLTATITMVLLHTVAAAVDVVASPVVLVVALLAPVLQAHGAWAVHPGLGIWILVTWRRLSKSYLGNIADLNNDTTKKEDGAQTDFNPPIDLFDTSEAYHIHVSLPGAKKEDIGVSYDADNSQVNIAGVVHRPGDEDFQKTLAMGERKVGVFERKVKLGTRAEPANVDADGISAKMEDGVLKVNVPKEEGGFVDVRKVDIE